MKNVGPTFLRLRLALWLLFTASCPGLLAQSGVVKSGVQPIPGAVVTARQESHTVSTVTDQNGRYSFPPLGPGTWSVAVEMFGFETVTKDVDYSAAKGPANFDLRLNESTFLKRLQQFTAGRNGAPGLQNRNTSGQQFDQELQNELSSQQRSVTPQGSANAASNIRDSKQDQG